MAKTYGYASIGDGSAGAFGSPGGIMGLAKDTLTLAAGVTAYFLSVTAWANNETGVAVKMKGGFYTQPAGWGNDPTPFLGATAEITIPIAGSGWYTALYTAPLEISVSQDLRVCASFDVSANYLYYQNHDGGISLCRLLSNDAYDLWPDPWDTTGTPGNVWISIYGSYYETPQVTTDAASSITENTATLNGTLDDDGGNDAGCSCYFEWGLTDSYGNTTAEQSGKVSYDTFLQALTTLLPNTKYHYRAVAKSTIKADPETIAYGYGDDVSFTTSSVYEGGETSAQGFVSTIRRIWEADANQSTGGKYKIELGLGGFGRGITAYAGPDTEDRTPEPFPNFYYRYPMTKDLPYTNLPPWLGTRPSLEGPRTSDIPQQFDYLPPYLPTTPPMSPPDPAGESYSNTIGHIHRFNKPDMMLHAGNLEKRLRQLANSPPGSSFPPTEDVVVKALFDANTILKADTDNTPAALTVAEQRLVGRITSGVITALTAAQVKTMLAIDHGADLAGLSDVADHAYALLIDGTRALAGAWDMGSQATTNVNIDSGVITGITDLAVADGGTGASNAGDARTNLGLVIGTNVLAYDAGIQNLAGVAMAANKFYYTSGDNTHVAASVTAFARTLLDDADAATVKGTLSLENVENTAHSTDAHTMTIDGRDVSVDGSKLDGITSGANLYVHPNHSGEVTSVADGAQTIANSAVTLAKMANMATASLIYRKTAATGVPEVNSLATLKTDLALTGTNSGDNPGVTAVTGTSPVVSSGGTTPAISMAAATNAAAGHATAAHITAIEANTAKVTNATHSGEVTGSGALTITADAVTYAKMQNVSATDKVLGRATAGAGNVEEIACTAFARSILDDANEATFKGTVNLEIGTDVAAQTHASQHAWLGTDALADLHRQLMTFVVHVGSWQSHDGWTEVTNDTGSVLWTGIMQTTLLTGANNGSGAGIYSGDCGPLSPQQTGRPVMFDFQIGVVADCEARMFTMYTGEATPPSDTSKHIGWKIIDGDLYATNADGTTETATDTGVDYGDWGGGTLVIEGTGGTSIKYYVDGVLKATHTTNIPDSWSHFFWMGVKNTAAAGKELRIFQYGASVV